MARAEYLAYLGEENELVPRAAALFLKLEELSKSDIAKYVG